MTDYEGGEDRILTDGITEDEAQLDALAAEDPDSYWYHQRYDAMRHAEEERERQERSWEIDEARSEWEATHYLDTDSVWKRKHDMLGGPHDGFTG